MGFFRTNIRLFEILALILIILDLLACSAYLQMQYPLNADVTMHVNAAERILRGETLYRDIVTVGFPIQFYLRIPPIYIAQKLGLNTLHLTCVIDNIYGLLSLYLLYLIIRKLPFAKFLPLLLLCAVGSVYAVFIISVVPNSSIGEKEYYFWIFTLPYFVLTAARVESLTFSKLLRMSIGMVAALGFMFKPVTVIPLVFVEAYCCVQAKTIKQLLKAELITCVSLGVAYIFWMLVCLPDYWRLIRPLFPFYMHMRPEIMQVISDFAKMMLGHIILLVALITYLCRTNPPFAKFLLVLCFAAVGDILQCMMQMKLFYHHFYPVHAMVLVIFTFACILFFCSPATYINTQNFWKYRFNIPVCCAGAVLAALVSYNCYYASTTYIEGYEPVLNYALRLYRQEKQTNTTPSVYIFTIHAGPIFPAGISRGIPWDYHFNHLWLMDGIIRFKWRNADHMTPEDHARITWAEQYLRETTAKDIERLKPDVIIAESYKMPQPNTYSNPIEYFALSPEFAKAFAPYHEEVDHKVKRGINNPYGEHIFYFHSHNRTKKYIIYFRSDSTDKEGL